MGERGPPRDHPDRRRHRLADRSAGHPPDDPARPALWLIFPAAWIVYVLIRGALVGKYPYPFLDPANGGYATVAVYCAGILVLMLAICAVTAWVGNAVGGRPIGVGQPMSSRTATVTPMTMIATRSANGDSRRPTTAPS